MKYTHSTREVHPIRHKPCQTFNKFRTVEHSSLLKGKSSASGSFQRSSAPQAWGNVGGFVPGSPFSSSSASQAKKLNPRYQYSEVRSRPTRVHPDSISPYVQLKKKKYKPREAEEKREKVGKGKEKKGVAKVEIEDEGVGEDEDEDEDEEVTANIRNITARVLVKRGLSKLHPTRSLAVGTLKRNVILAQETEPSQFQAAASSTAQTTALTYAQVVASSTAQVAVSSSAQTTGLSAQTPGTTAQRIDTSMKYKDLSLGRSTCIIDLICSMTEVWNYGKRDAQYALLNVMSMDSNSSLRTKFIDMFKDKCERKKAAKTLSDFLKPLLLNTCGGKTNQQRDTGNVKLARDIYNIYINQHGEGLRPLPSKFAVSGLTGPLSVEIAKSITMHWKTQNEYMVAKVTYQDVFSFLHCYR